MYRIEYQLEGGEAHTVDVDGRDIRAWEAENTASFLMSDFTYTQLTDLARIGLARSGVLTLSRDEFNAQCISVKEVAREPADPT